MQSAMRHQVQNPTHKAELLAAMAVLGCAALLLPAWLTNVREHAPTRRQPEALVPSQDVDPGQALFRGLHASLDRASDGLRRGSRTQASQALDEAWRVAQAGSHSAPGSFYSSLEQIRAARIALQMGNEAAAAARVELASNVLQPASGARPPVLELSRYSGAKVIDAEGAVIGEVARVRGDSLELALGGWRDAWGFVDFSTDRRVVVPSASLAFGPPDAIGMKLVAASTQRNPVAGLIAPNQPHAARAQ